MKMLQKFSSIIIVVLLFIMLNQMSAVDAKYIGSRVKPIGKNQMPRRLACGERSCE